MSADMARASIIFNAEEMGRLRQVDDQTISVDMHGLNRYEGKQFLKNLVVLAKQSRKITVIHGFHSGQVLMNMIREEFHSDRVTDIEPDDRNPGRTILKIA